MMHRCSTWICCLAILLLASCTRTPDGLPAPKVGIADPKDKGPASPYCVLEQVTDQKFDEQMRLTIWDLRMHGVKKLTVQLLLAQDGKSTPMQASNHEWNQWPKERPAMTGKVFYIMRTEKGKRFPSLCVEIKSDSSTGFQGIALVNDAVVPLLD